MTTSEKLKDNLEQLLLLTWGEIVAQIESIDEKALALLTLEQKMHLHEMVIEAAGRCANFASAYYCDAGDILTVKGNIDKVTFQPGVTVTVTVTALNTPDNIISLAEMGSGVSIHGLQTVIPGTVATTEPADVSTGANSDQMTLGDGTEATETPQGGEIDGEAMAEGDPEGENASQGITDGIYRKVPEWFSEKKKNKGRARKAVPA